MKEKKIKSKWVWGFPNNSDVCKIPKDIHADIIQILTQHMKTISPNVDLNIRFKSEFCYVYTIEDGHNMPLCRLRFYGDIKQWELGFYKYSDEKYEECMFGSGKMRGTLEEALNVCRIYL